MAISNSSLLQAIAKLQNIKQDKDIKFYEKQNNVHCWVRPNSGPGNPRTKIEGEGDTPLSSSVSLLYQAVQDYRQQHPLQAVPKWVVEAERMFDRMQGK